jgi:hypothetical protein
MKIIIVVRRRVMFEVRFIRGQSLGWEWISLGCRRCRVRIILSGTGLFIRRLGLAGDAGGGWAGGALDPFVRSFVTCLLIVHPIISICLLSQNCSKYGCSNAF